VESKSVKFAIRLFTFGFDFLLAFGFQLLAFGFQLLASGYFQSPSTRLIATISPT